MNENKSIWRKTQAELTVRDQFVVSAAIVGMLFGAAAVATGVGKVEEMLRTRRDRKNNTEG